MFYVAIPLLIVIFLVSMWGTNLNSTELKYSEFLDLFRSDRIQTFELNLSSRDVKYQLKDSQKVYSYEVPNSELFVNDFEKIKDSYNLQTSYNIEAGGEANWILSMLPTLLLIALMVGFWIFMSKRMGSMGADKTLSFGKAKFKNSADEKKKTMFSDVAGADEEKEELQEIVEFLKDPKKYNELGARIPKGVLLVGPPGTGKTLLAKAVAGEAGVPFYSISGSDFVEMFVGVGASRVRDLFETAKKNSPAIVFIDEIDAVGRQRGAGLGGGHDEREQTLNQLLVEMDGFGANEGVIIIAATNRPDILDKALLRPGRFDRQVTVNYPDVKGREEILKVHARGKPLAPDVDLKTVAKSTAGFTGADIENLLNESALLAARNNKKAITEADIEQATIKVIAGTEKKSWVLSDEEKINTAYHEAGHAITGYYLPTQDDIHHITIVPRGRALGMTISLPEKDKFSKYRDEMKEEIVMLLGGRIAERLYNGDNFTTGASNDIERATKIARDMVVKYGMSDELGPILYANSNDEVFLGRDYGHIDNVSQTVASKIDVEIKKIIDEAYKKGEEILKTHIDKLHLVSKRLFEKEKIDSDEFKEIMESETTLPVSEK